MLVAPTAIDSAAYAPHGRIACRAADLYRPQQQPHSSQRANGQTKKLNRTYRVTNLAMAPQRQSPPMSPLLKEKKLPHGHERDPCGASLSDDRTLAGERPGIP